MNKLPEYVFWLNQIKHFIQSYGFCFSGIEDQILICSKHATPCYTSTFSATNIRLLNSPMVKELSKEIKNKMNYMKTSNISNSWYTSNSVRGKLSSLNGYIRKEEKLKVRLQSPIHHVPREMSDIQTGGRVWAVTYRPWVWSSYQNKKHKKEHNKHKQ